MKKHASLYWASLISLATTVVCLGADGTASNTAPATVITPQAAPVAAVSPQTPALPFGVAEVVKMYQNGIGKEVLIGYINSTVLPFHLSADGIIYLQHLGLPQEVTTALLRRDGELQKQAATAYQQQSQPPPQQPAPNGVVNYQAASGNPAPTVVVPGTPPPVVAPYPMAAPDVIYPDYSVYPYYGYPYYYGPNVVISGGFGWGLGHGWGRGGFGHGGFGHR